MKTRETYIQYLLTNGVPKELINQEGAKISVGMSWGKWRDVGSPEPEFFDPEGFGGKVGGIIDDIIAPPINAAAKALGF